LRLIERGVLRPPPASLPNRRFCSSGEMSQISLSDLPGIASLQSGMSSMIASPLVVHPWAIEAGAF
jgi:hypothetical protein